MIFKDENNNIIEPKNVWKYEHVRSDLNTVYLKTPSTSYLRYLRQIHCFSLINRGTLWYETLPDNQKEELKVWYKKWLDVTQTKIIPDKPYWLK